MSEELKRAFHQKVPALIGRVRESLGGEWGDTDRVLVAPFEDRADCDGIADLMLQCTEGEKSRLGICFLAIQTWERMRVQALQPVARTLIAQSSYLRMLTNEISSLKLSASSAPALDVSKLRDEIVADVKQSIIPLLEKNSPAPAVSLEPVSSKLDDLLSLSAKRDLEIQRARDERAAREAAAAAAKAKRQAAEEESKARKLAAQARKKEERASAKARRLAIKEALRKGENPYTEEETAKFKAALEKKGKKFYTFEERAAHRAALEVVKDAPKKKEFKRYSEKQKQQYIKENFTSKGRVYYSKEQRLAFQKKRAAALAPVNPESSGHVPGFPGLARGPAPGC